MSRSTISVYWHWDVENGRAAEIEREYDRSVAFAVGFR